MTILEDNFKIECEGQSFTLYFLEKEKEKLLGYYTDLSIAFKRAAIECKKKKKEYKHILLYAKKYINLQKRLNVLSKVVYRPIHILDSKVNGIRKIQSSTRT